MMIDHRAPGAHNASVRARRADLRSVIRRLRSTKMAGYAFRLNPPYGLALEQRRHHLLQLLDAHAALHHLAVDEQSRRGLHFVVLGAALAHREDVVIELLVREAVLEALLREARLLADLQQRRKRVAH